MNGSSMCDEPFVNTFQNKDNLLTYTKKICKISYKMQKILFLSFVLSFFFQTRKLSIYLFVLQLQNLVVYSACRKMFFLS